MVTGQKIFRGWRKKAGEENRDGWLSVTVITGIHRENPLDYRTAIGISESFITTKMKGKRLFTMVYRMNDMTPSSSQNLDILRDHFKRAGFVILAPVAFNPALGRIEIKQENLDLAIKLSHLDFIPAWKVGANSPLISAMRGITDPVIPQGITEVPYLQALEHLMKKANAQ
ncbi:hypothetical protein [Comamonas thiooxydans]|uniref:hypothetical protein n=1 Tax=Comamonas thiooxydans TaxID=363952 RepID=UPI00103CC031|nr:hypothetical protein [Comamonas thiooxydans]